MTALPGVPALPIRDIVIRLPIGGQLVIEVRMPPEAWEWLESRGMGIDYVAKRLPILPITESPVVSPKPEMPPPESMPEAQALRNPDGSFIQPGAIQLEAWLKANPGCRSFPALVSSYYGVSEDAARELIYENRGKSSAGTNFYRVFRNDLVAALEALAVQGIQIVTPSQRPTMPKVPRNSWGILPSPAKEANDAA